ncbi:MAG: hypothetical protein AAGF45_03970 [Pseudomonadota bacterium]
MPGVFEGGRPFLITWSHSLRNRSNLPAQHDVTAGTTMRKRPPPILGVLRLDYDYPANLGDIDRLETFSYDVIYRVIPGLTFEMCQSGDLTEQVKNACIDSLRFLDSFNVNAITGDCGFMINIQDTIRSNTHRPVFLSALIQLPTIINSIGIDDEIAVYTANGRSLETIESQLDTLCGLREHSHRLKIVGCESVPGFDAVAAGKKVDEKKVGAGLLELTSNVIRNNPNIKCILLECTELPPYANAIRYITGLPVYDAVTNCDMFMSGFLENSNFGMHGWQQAWSGTQDPYKFGENLTEFEKALLVSNKPQ